MSKTMSCRPSTLLSIDDQLAAFCFDRAVFSFGTALKSELDSVKGKTEKEIENAQERVIRKWIPDLPTSKKYADPAARKG